MERPFPWVVLYKKDDSGTDVSVLRGFHRLMVLMELFDEGVMATIHHLGPQTDSPIGAIVRYLEEAYQSIAGDRPYDRELTGLVVRSLYSIVPGASSLDKVNWLRGWVDGHLQKLHAALLEANSADHLANIFARQPEALLIYSLIEQDPFTFRDRWSEEWDTTFLHYFETSWGKSLLLE